MTPSPTLRILGISMDLGQKRRGVDMGPSALRYAGLNSTLAQLGYTIHDGGNITAPLVDQIEHPTHGDSKQGLIHYLPQVAEVCQQVYQTATDSLQHGEKIIFLGGDHSLSIGTVTAVNHERPVGVIWVDAHTDINTPFTTPSGSIHGMCVAALLGDGAEALTHIGGDRPAIQPDQLVYIGVRDLDPPEQERLRRGDILIHTMRDIDQQGIPHTAQNVLKHLDRFERIHVSLDMDSLDPTLAPGVGTPVRGGLRYREAHLLMEMLADSGKVSSLDIVEVNPILDQGNSTAELAVGLAASLFGKRIL